MADEQDCQEEVDRFLGDLSSALDAGDEARVLSMLRSLVTRPPMLGDAVVQGMDLLIRAGLTHASSLQPVADVWDRAAQHCGARDLVPIFLAATGYGRGERSACQLMRLDLGAARPWPASTWPLPPPPAENLPMTMLYPTW